MKVWKIPYQRWREFSITAKFGSAFGLLLALIVSVAITGYVSLTFVRNATEAVILTSTKIQRLVLEMESGMEKARLLHRDFFLQYTKIGFKKARELYAERCIQQIAKVVTLSAELQQLIAESEVSDALRKSDVNLNLYLSSAKRFSDTFLESVELVTTLATPETGLQAQMAQYSVSLRDILDTTDDHSLTNQYRDMRAFEKEYLITRQRPFMQSAFNAAFRLRRAIENTTTLKPDRKVQARTHLDNYETTAKEILGLDVVIRSKFNDFALQAEAVDPISKELIALAETEVDYARTQISHTKQVAIIILAVTALAGLLLATAIAIVLNNSITRNVVRLTKSARQLQAGNLDIHAQIKSADELGQLATSFNAMAARIRNLVRDLEQKVGELQFTNAVLATQQDTSIDGILVVDTEGRMVSFNQKFVDMWGIPSEVVESKSDELALQSVLDKLVEPEAFLERVKYLYDHPEEKSWEEIALVGSVTFERYSAPMYGQHGRYYGRVWYFRDITARKQAEEDMNRLRNLLSNIVDSMPSTLVAMDNEGKVTQWNREAEKITGVTAQKAQGRTLEVVFPQLAEEMEKIRLAIRKREPQKDEKIATRLNGETRFSDVAIYPLIGNGVEGAVIRVDDVTERVRMEEMMIQSEKMMSVGGLAAGMAHEINNPLAAILQNAQVVLNRISEDLPANQQAAADCGTSMEAIKAFMEKRDILKMLQAIRSSGGQAANIVENMLSFSRKSESVFQPYTLSNLLDKTVELASKDYDLKKKYDFRQIEIVREYDPDLPDVPCEETKIQQVILNLLKNAAQSMAESAKHEAPSTNGVPGKAMRLAQSVMREPPCITLRLLQDRDMVRIELEDNGPGMNEADRKRIFEPFFTTKDVGEGTGLGLSVSYFIITENHGGTMTVESVPGKGSKFIIRLPLERDL